VLFDDVAAQARAAANVKNVLGLAVRQRQQLEGSLGHATLDLDDTRAAANHNNHTNNINKGKIMLWAS
jgi:hypothetical protein